MGNGKWENGKMEKSLFIFIHSCYHAQSAWRCGNTFGAHCFKSIVAHAAGGIYTSERRRARKRGVERERESFWPAVSHQAN